ncbi:MAG: Fe-S cluster assembly scaffold protein NifU [Acetobacteraceae bacterium]|nr:Fe-S cluster assembly scaffold protein NifU [Acetobacteraceae bacterium]
MYSEKVMEHFTNPRNVGEIPDADGVGQVGNPVCGDIMRMYIKVRRGRIADIKFKTFGCGAAIATSSMVTELVKGKSVAEALEISNRTVAEALGGLPPHKMHCSNLAADALHRAIQDYLGKKKASGAEGRGARVGTRAGRPGRGGAAKQGRRWSGRRTGAQT